MKPNEITIDLASVLVVCEGIDDRRLVQLVLEQRAGAEVELVRDALHFAAALARGGWSAVIAAARTSWTTADGLAVHLKSLESSPPLIVLAEVGQEPLANRAIDAGALDAVRPDAGGLFRLAELVRGLARPPGPAPSCPLCSTARGSGSSGARRRGAWSRPTPPRCASVASAASA